MPSLFPSFEYDIFISYRHNDNRSGWVTEFVSALQEELAATIKEPLSIYFDRNPHDGLLETHDVDQSLEGKLKCLIFIPILSQTYCDPKSFAWQHEFCAFNNLVKEDKFGRDIKLHSGNVASRILQIKIHDLDADDKATIENEFGGAIRAIEFIYKESGVNRPLKPADDKRDNLSKTDYRNQVNKVANAIKETISALKTPLSIPAQAAIESSTVNHPKSFKRVLTVFLLAVLIGASGYFLYPKLFASKSEILIDKSIAVLPFVNVSRDPDQEYFSDGLTDELLSMLARVPGLKVTGRTSSFAFKEKQEDLRTIGAKLGVRYLLEGSVRMSGKNLRINTQLIKADDGTQLWAEQFDRTADDVFKVQSEISQAVISNLKLSVLGVELNNETDKNVELYKQQLQGYYFGRQSGPENLQKAIDKFQSILKVDSLYSKAWGGLSVVYLSLALNDFMPYHTGIERSRGYAKKALSINPELPEGHGTLAAIHRTYDYDWEAAKKEIDLGLRYDPQNPGLLAQSGNLKTLLGDYVSGTEDLIKSVEINPLDAYNHRELALNYLTRNMYDEAEKEFLLAYELAPDGYTMPWYVIHFYIQRENLDKAEEYLKKPAVDNCIACAGMQAVVLNKRGKIVEAKKRLEWLEKNHADYWAGAIAMTYAMLDEKEVALGWLERAIKQHDPDITNAQLRVEFRKYTNDDRYVKAMKSINLDPGI